MAALRGFAYQLYATGLAWVALADNEILYVEVADDFAVAAGDALVGVQVKDTAGSGSVTIRSEGVIAAIDNLVDLQRRNAGRQIAIRYLTTAEIGLERATEDRADSGPTLQYWRRAASGADVAPLRAVLGRLKLKQATHDFINGLGDEALRLELLKRIHWQCGQAPLEKIERDLEDGLVEFATSALGLYSNTGVKLTGEVIRRLLAIAARKKERRLRRADLIKLAGEVGTVTLRETDHQALLGALASRGSPLDKKGLLILGGADEGPRHVHRDALVEKVLDRARQGPAVFITGSSGLGKTTVARTAASKLTSQWHRCDFRGFDPGATAGRLAAARLEVLASSASVLLLDDLDLLDHPTVCEEAQRLVDVLRRRDGIAIVTSALEPPGTVRQKLAGNGTPAVPVPYLARGEIEELIRSAGGDPRLAALVRAAASGGHPQLVQAAILHLEANGWDETAAATLLGGGSGDIEAERQAARRRIVDALDENARTLLFRTSLIAGRFERPLAIAIGDVDPRLKRPGEQLDRLVGPWIEPVERAELRVSPLIAQAGVEVLGPSEQEAVHRQIAEFYLNRRRVEADASDLILYHSLQGGASRHLVAFASSVITSPAEMLGILGRHAPMLRALNLDGPLVPNDAHASALLRLAQFLVALASDQAAYVQGIWQSLGDETRRLPNAEQFEEVILAKALIHEELSEKLPEWLDLLLRYDEIAQSSPRLKSVEAELDSRGSQGATSGFLFLVQVVGLQSIASLRSTFERLDAAAADVRARMLSGATRAGGFSYLLNSVWLKEARRGSLEAEGAARDYLTMADLAEAWGIGELAARCHATAAIMLDEYGRSPERALSIISEAERRLGPSLILSRTRAKVNWRRRDHAAALAEFESLNEAEIEDPVERVYVAREAGISSAELGRHSEAADWFERGREHAQSVPARQLAALAIGLGADAAQAAYLAGDTDLAVDRYARALAELRSLDPEESLQAAYVHRVVRHAVLWLDLEAEGNEVPLDEPIVLPPGACSNPDPPEAIRKRPLGDLDLAWYLLADAELALGSRRIQSELHERLASGPILPFEVARPRKAIQAAIAGADGAEVARQLLPYAASTAMFDRSGEELLRSQLETPLRGVVPPPSPEDLALPVVRSKLHDAVLALGVSALLLGRRAALRELRDGAADPLLHGIRGLIRRLAGGEAMSSTADEKLAETIAAITGSDPVDPDAAASATIRLTLFVENSGFRKQLEAGLGVWATRVWTDILKSHRFRLAARQVNAPPIVAALEEDGRRPLARSAAIALAALPATRVRVDDGVRRKLDEIANDAS